MTEPAQRERIHWRFSAKATQRLSELDALGDGE
jgi:hypothetical protein